MNKHTEYFQAMNRHSGLWGRVGQEKIREATIVVGGVGGIGAISALMLAKSGIGRIRVCDLDAYEVDNIVEQAFATYDTVGKSKAETARKEMERHTRFAEIEAFNGDLSNRKTAERLAEDADVIVSGVDNAEARIMLGRVAEDHEVPLVVSANVGWSVLHTMYFPGEYNYGSVWRDVDGITWRDGFPDMQDPETREAVEKEWNIWVAALSRFRDEAISTFIEEDPSFYWYAAPQAYFAASLGIMDTIKFITGEGNVHRFPDILYYDVKDDRMLSWEVLKERRDALREVWDEGRDSITRVINEWR